MGSSLPSEKEGATLRDNTYLRYRVVPLALALALILAGCGALAGGSASGSATELPTQAPTEEPSPLPPSPAPEGGPTPPPSPDAAEPTPSPGAAEPTPPPTPSDSPTAGLPAGSRILPATVPWVRIGNQAYALGAGDQALDLTLGGQFYPPATAATSPDGSRIAFSDSASTPRRLVVLNVAVETGEPEVITLPPDEPGDATEGVFAPDSAAIAYTLLGVDTWQLRVADLRSGAERTLAEGPTVAQGPGHLPLVPLPVAWTPAGLIVQRVLWATDAPAQAVALIDPLDGALRAEVAIEHLAIAPAPGGTQVALVTGIAPIGEAPRQGVRVVDLQSGAERELLPEQSAQVRGVRWSPDGAMVLVSSGTTWNDPVTSLRVMNADGSGEQVVEFGAQGLALELRDIAWADEQTPLVLVLDQQAGQVQLHALPVTSFDASGLRLLGEFPAPENAGETVDILYVPG